jgi:hypothetical protein
MNNFIDVVEQHTNNETMEDAAQAGLISAVITGVFYCLSLLL